MRISILIPTFNRASFLPQAIESALAQTHSELEILVVDNASTDATPAIARRYSGDTRLRYERNASNLGMVGNWRRALYDLSSGDWFLVLSDDDYLTDPEYLAKAATLISAHPQLAMVYANGLILEVQTGTAVPLVVPFRGIVPGKDVFLSRGRVRPQDFTLCNVLFNRRLAVEEEAFHNLHDIGCDSELFLRLCLRGDVGVCSDSVSVYRRHTTNLVESFHNDYDLLVETTEWFFEPYRRAMSSGRFSDQELSDWMRCVVRPSLTHALSQLERHHEHRFRKALTYLEQRHGPVFRMAVAKTRFEPLLLKLRRRLTPF